MPVITPQQAIERGVGKAGLAAVAKWNRDAAKKAKKPKDRQRYHDQAKALAAVIEQL